ncbi:hypothetical protein E2C01_023448 [Portunus trituberculatus]|uniref:Uncharacterized protein n=1 Tax=Portunus trituberculatus TaxID=210409 RepID=A0A5B7E8U1_PORTR|nr:hypothetical protein [Portunus trituberculatus]
MTDNSVEYFPTFPITSSHPTTASIHLSVLASIRSPLPAPQAPPPPASLNGFYLYQHYHNKTTVNFTYNSDNE